MLLLRKLMREIQFHSPWRRKFFPRYSYNFTPNQLCFLTKNLYETKDINGAIAEIGCETGRTTIFLNKFMDENFISKDYIAMDTFSGFTTKDIDYEVNNRNKEKKIKKHFRLNSKRWFDGTMKQNKITRVRSIKCDVNETDLSTYGPFSFVLLDVDLYLPMKKALPEIYNSLAENGVIIIDDCDPDVKEWDGSLQAYKEFTDENKLDFKIHFKKLGFIKKNT